jgi:hypothetical protein
MFVLVILMIGVTVACGESYPEVDENSVAESLKDVSHETFFDAVDELKGKKKKVIRRGAL